MMLDEQTCYRALVARDVRFDGLFFVGVTTADLLPASLHGPHSGGTIGAVLSECGFGRARSRFRPCLRCRAEMGQRGRQSSVDAVQEERPG